MKCTIFHAIGVLGVVAIGGITLYMLNWLGPIKYNDFDTIVMMIIGFTIYPLGDQPII